MGKKSFSNVTSPASLFVSVPQEKQEAEQTPPAQSAVREAPQAETKSRRMQLLVRPSTAAALKAKAQQQGKSVNDLINSILEEAVKG